MKRTFKSNVSDSSSDSAEEKETTDGDKSDPEEQADLRVPESENFSGSIEASFSDVDDIIDNDSIVAPPSHVEFSPPRVIVSVDSAPNPDWDAQSSSLDVLVGTDIQSELLRQRAESTRGGPDGTEPHPDFGKETKKSVTTEGADPQSASQANEDVQEIDKRVLPSVSDDEEEASSSRKTFSQRFSRESVCFHKINFEEESVFMCPESSSTRSGPDGNIYKITTISTPLFAILKRKSKPGFYPANVKIEPDAHQTPSERINPPVTSEHYPCTDEHLDLETQGTESCGSPTRAHHHPGPVPEDNSSSSSCEDMFSISSDLDKWTPEVLTETDGTEEDDNITETLPKLPNETMNLYEPVKAVKYNQLHLVQPSGSGLRTHVGSPRPRSCPTVTQETSADIKVSTRAASLPNMTLQSSFEEFTPDFTDDEDDEAFRFRCSGPGLYQCRETGLVFDMKAEGDVFYRMVPWNRILLSQHHKKPAGPLFDLTCQQHSVAQLHLPHCEVRSTGGAEHLSVAHVDHEGLEFIRPEQITETHIVINITGFSAFGNVKDVDSPADPVRALVLLFYKLPAEPDADHLINVLLLPKNVAIGDVLRFRKKLDRDETFLETPPHCKLQPQQAYTLSTGSGDDSVLVQPTEAEFDQESYDNYLPTFQVVYKSLMKHMKLFLRDSSSASVWERRVCLSSFGINRSCGSTRQIHRPDEQLSETRISFIDGISGPVLQSLLDKLLESKVLCDSERETAEEERNRRDKARFVIDTVRRKGEAAGSEMIHFLCELDPFLCEHLGFM